MGDDKSKGPSMTPKMSFILGLVGGVLVICTIGFFVVGATWAAFYPRRRIQETIGSISGVARLGHGRRG